MPFKLLFIFMYNFLCLCNITLLFYLSTARCCILNRLYLKNVRYVVLYIFNMYVCMYACKSVII